MRKAHHLLYLGFLAVAACEADTVTTIEPLATDGGFAHVDASRDDGSAAPPSPVPEPPAQTPSFDAGPLPEAADVEVVITTDNAFSFGYGDAERVDTYLRGVPSGGPEIFDCPVDYGPEPFLVPGAQAPDGAYLYIVAWADPEWTQGALAQFRRAGSSETIYSGDGAWEVCATGVAFDGLGEGPDQDTVNQHLAQCNTGAQGSTASKGWVNTEGALTPGAVGKLAYGEANDDAAGDFPIVCQRDDAGVAGIDSAARWMWYDPEDGQSPFVGNLENRTKAFLIFRLPAEVLVVF